MPNFRGLPIHIPSSVLPTRGGSGLRASYLTSQPCSSCGPALRLACGGELRGERLRRNSVRFALSGPSHCHLRHRFAITCCQRAPPPALVRGWTSPPKPLAAKRVYVVDTSGRPDYGGGRGRGLGNVENDDYIGGSRPSGTIYDVRGLLIARLVHRKRFRMDECEKSHATSSENDLE